MDKILVVIILYVLLFIIIGMIGYDIYQQSGNEYFDQCDNPTPSSVQMAAMGSSCQDACNRIASRAEQIKSKYPDMPGIVNAALTALNPTNYKAGDNNSQDIIRNIVNINLSSCDITKISTDCVNSASTIQPDQINTSDASQCRACQNKPPFCSNVSSIDQNSITKISQTCSIQSAIETLLKKTSSIDAQALAIVLQEAEANLIGTTYQKKNCDIIDNQVPISTYLNGNAACANTMTIDQNNSLKFCGNVAGIVQKNQFDSLQQCLNEVDFLVSTNNSSSNKDNMIFLYVALIPVLILGLGVSCAVSMYLKNLPI